MDYGTFGHNRTAKDSQNTSGFRLAYNSKYNNNNSLSSHNNSKFKNIDIVKNYGKTTVASGLHHHQSYYNNPNTRSHNNQSTRARASTSKEDPRKKTNHNTSRQHLSNADITRLKEQFENLRKCRMINSFVPPSSTQSQQHLNSTNSFLNAHASQSREKNRTRSKSRPQMAQHSSSTNISHNNYLNPSPLHIFSNPKFDKKSVQKAQALSVSPNGPRKTGGSSIFSRSSNHNPINRTVDLVSHSKKNLPLDNVTIFKPQVSNSGSGRKHTKSHQLKSVSVMSLDDKLSLLTKRLQQIVQSNNAVPLDKSTISSHNTREQLRVTQQLTAKTKANVLNSQLRVFNESISYHNTDRVIHDSRNLIAKSTILNQSDNRVEGQSLSFILNQRHINFRQGEISKSMCLVAQPHPPGPKNIPNRTSTLKDCIDSSKNSQMLLDESQKRYSQLSARLIRNFRPHRLKTNCVSFSESFMYSCSDDYTVVRSVLDPQRQLAHQKMYQHRGRVNCVYLFSDDLVFSGGADCYLRSNRDWSLKFPNAITAIKPLSDMTSKLLIKSRNLFQVDLETLVNSQRCILHKRSQILTHGRIGNKDQLSIYDYRDGKIRSLFRMPSPVAFWQARQGDQDLVAVGEDRTLWKGDSRGLHFVSELPDSKMHQNLDAEFSICQFDSRDFLISLKRGQTSELWYFDKLNSRVTSMDFPEIEDDGSLLGSVPESRDFILGNKAGKISFFQLLFY